MLDGLVATVVFNLGARFLGETYKSLACSLAGFTEDQPKHDLPFSVRTLSIAAAAASLQPLLTLATVQRISHAPLADCARHIHRVGGAVGFYRGWGSTLLYVFASQIVYHAAFNGAQALHGIFWLQGSSPHAQQKVAPFVTFPE